MVLLGKLNREMQTLLITEIFIVQESASKYYDQQKELLLRLVDVLFLTLLALALTSCSQPSDRRSTSISMALLTVVIPAIRFALIVILIHVNIVRAHSTYLKCREDAPIVTIQENTQYKEQANIPGHSSLRVSGIKNMNRKYQDIKKTQ